MKYLKKSLALIIASVTMFTIIFNGLSSFTIDIPQSIDNTISKEQYDSIYNVWKLSKDSAAKADTVIKLVDKHIKSIAPKTKVSAKALVTTSAKYNIDIRLTLAQAQQESHFGTTGIARRTNSIFNVNSRDGWSSSYIKKRGLGYKSPDHSIEPWAKLIKNKYLVNGKTEKQLIRNFVNSSGKRYASSKQYEARLQHIYYNIPKEIVTQYNDYRRFVNTN